MGGGRQRSLDRVGSLIVVLGGHMLLFAVLVSGRFAEQRKLTTDSQDPSIWIPVSPDISTPQQQTDKPDRRVQPRATRPVSPHAPGGVGVAPAEPPGPSSGPPQPEDELVAPSAPDWTLEAEAVARSMAPGMIHELQRKCAEAERRAEALPEGCPKHSFAKRWEPQPKRAGFVGIFPYVRVGRCIIGLGFWGCAVSKSTPAGNLFEDFRDPNRPRSSVPDTPTPLWSQPPLPQVFKDPYLQ